MFVHLCGLVAMFPWGKVWDCHDCKLHASVCVFVPFTCKQPTAKWVPAGQRFCENGPDQAVLVVPVKRV